MSTGALSLSLQQNQAYMENLKKESRKEKVFMSQKYLQKYLRPSQIHLQVTQPTFTCSKLIMLTPTLWEIYSKLTIKTRTISLRRSVVFIVNFRHIVQILPIFQIVLLFPSLTLN